MKVRDIIDDRGREKQVTELGPEGLQVVKANSYVTPGSEEDWTPDVKDTEYDILDKSGKKVGELRTDDYFGYVHGNLYGKDLPELSHYNWRTGKGPFGNLIGFLRSKTGRRWAQNLHKYQ